jgi:hypothetical protein
MKELTDFQKKFFARGTASRVFTQEEFDEALALAKAEIMQIAIDTTKTAIAIEREECAKVCEQFEPESFYLGQVKAAAQAIRNRTKK